MHVVMLSDHETRGGAAIAASRLAVGLLQAGVRITRLVAYPNRQANVWHSESLAAPLFPLRRVARRAVPLAARASLDELAVVPATQQLRRALARLQPDYLHLHNLHGGIGAGWSIDMLAAAGEVAPVLWTLHDMWSLTGRCVYNGECMRFVSGCNAACPTAREYPALPPERIAVAWERRRAAIAAAPRLAAVAPSYWMADQARAGIWAGRRVAHIPYGLDLALYQPVERAAARQQLGITVDGPLVLVAMPHLGDPRKGAGLLHALAAVPGLPALTILTMGAGQLRVDIGTMRVLPFGYVADEARRALVFSAADLLLHAAPADNLPLTVIEALACGTPVVALPVGGLPELVRPGSTGWLAAVPSPASLAIALAAALAELAAGMDLRATCRATAEAEYGSAICVAHHIALYQAL